MTSDRRNQVEGRLHFYRGDLVETSPEEPYDAAAIKSMSQKQGWDRAITREIVSGPDYVMCDYVGNDTIARIAIKALAPDQLPSEAAQAEARSHIEAWAAERGVTLEWVPYSELFAR
jgi:hypothetical protein